MKTLKYLALKTALIKLNEDIEKKRLVPAYNLNDDLLELLLPWKSVKYDVTLTEIRQKALSLCLSNRKAFEIYFREKIKGINMLGYHTCDLVEEAIINGHLSALPDIAYDIHCKTIDTNPFETFELACIHGREHDRDYEASDIFFKNKASIAETEYFDAVDRYDPAVEERVDIWDSLLGRGLWIALELGHTEIFFTLLGYLDDAYRPSLLDYFFHHKDNITITDEHIKMLKFLEKTTPDSYLIKKFMSILYKEYQESSAQADGRIGKLEIEDGVLSHAKGSEAIPFDLLKADLAGVTSVGRMAFFYCASLVSIEISDSVTSIGQGVFDGCTRLTSIEIPNSVSSIGSGPATDPDSVASIGSGPAAGI